MALGTRALVAVLLAAVIIGAAGYSLGALAHGTTGTSQPQTAPTSTPGMGSWGMGGGMMGNGMMGAGQAGPMAQPGVQPMGQMGDAGHNGMMCDEGMMGSGMMGPGMGMEVDMASASVEGTVVGVENGLLVIETGDGTVQVKVLPVYVDPETGYLVSGYWILDKIAEATGDSITVEGPGSGDFIVAWEISVGGMKTYTSPMMLETSH